MTRSLSAIALGLLLALGGCAAPGPAAAPPSPLPSGVVEGPEGAAFYTSPPAPAAAAAGDVIWARSVPAPVGAAGFMFLYWSTGLDGSLVPVSAVVFRPAEASAAPQPVVAWAHGTAGLGDGCAPSLEYRDEDLGLNSDLVSGTLGLGAAFVATDYRGLGTAGEHPYLVNEAAGRDVLDALRASRTFVGGESASVVMGESQGGGAALVAAELQATYAPDVDLRGGIGLATPASLNDLDSTLSGGPYVGYVLMTVDGYETAYPELAAGNSVLTEAGRTALEAIRAQCGLEILDAYEDQQLSVFGVDALLDGPAFSARLAENDPGDPTTVPLLLLHGEQDDTIPVQFARDLLRRYCAEGTVVRGRVFPDGGHQILGAAVQEVLPWVEDRFRGVAAPSSC